MKGQIQTLKLLNLCRFSIPSSSISRFTLSTNFNKLKFSSLLKAKSMQLSLSHRSFIFLSPLNIARNFRVSGSYTCCGSILGVSIASAPIIAHAMDAGDALVDDHETMDISEEEENLCQQFIRQETRFLRVKSLYASKVEVQDYKLLCLAAVEVRDQKFTLVGILGSWWTLPHLPFWEAFSFARNRIGSILVKTT